jgi:hypothetical protein
MTTQNPRIMLAFFWATLCLRATTGAMEAHTVTVLIGNLLGVIACPVLAYCELRAGLAERRARQTANM